MSKLKKLLEENLLLPIDIFFADRLLKEDAKEEDRLFLSKIMASARQGHLCYNPLLDPDLKSTYVWQKPFPFISQANDSKPSLIINYKDRFYLQKNWIYETQIIEEMKRFETFCKQNLLQVQLDPILTEEQKSACQAALQFPITFISGGPGRGKTFVASHIVHAFGKNKKIIVSAPTGKAAKHLHIGIKKLNPDIQCEFFTLHALLHAQKQSLKRRKVHCDLLIVDECSMIDARIFSMLLSAIGKQTKVVFLGDSDQLPPVELGNTFSELIRYADQSKNIQHVHLSYCHRTDRQNILDLANAVNEGSFEKITKAVQTFDEDVISQIPNYCEDLKKLSVDKFYYDDNSSIEDLLKQLQKYKILCATKKGPWGFDRLNKLIFEYFKKLKENFVYPILIQKNHYQLQLFNGEMGIVKNERAYFMDYENGGVKDYPINILPNYDLSYALSVHKSQGSEYDEVLLILPEGSEVFGRQLCYTAITRAKNSIKIFTDMEVFKQCIKVHQHKQSMLYIRLTNGD